MPRQKNETVKESTLITKHRIEFNSSQLTRLAEGHGFFPRVYIDPKTGFRLNTIKLLWQRVKMLNRLDKSLSKSDRTAFVDAGRAQLLGHASALGNELREFDLLEDFFRCKLK